MPRRPGATVSEPIRIAYMVSHPIQYQAPLLRLLAQQPEFDLKVFFYDKGTGEAYRDRGFNQTVAWDVPLLDGYPHETVASSWFRAFRTAKLSEQLASGKFEILWVHGYSHPACMRAIHEAHRCGIPILLRGDSNSFNGSRNPLRNVARRGRLAWVLPRCAGFLSIGQRNREFYRQHGIPEHRLFDVPHAVDNAFFQQRVALARTNREAFRRSLSLAPGRPVILFAGKLLKHKGPMDLLEAYLRLSPDGRTEPRPYLLFAGNGPERDKLERRAKTTGFPSIRFLGFQNQTELPALFDLCDLFVLPSHKEPWGLVVNEVMNAGKPVIVSDVAGCAPDLVSENNGWLFPAGDRSALTETLREALQNPERLRSMGQHSLDRIQRYSFDQDISGLLQAASRTLETRRGLAAAHR
jgi:glycosyltransferase involved in cell wall biosynthesis